MRAAIVLSFALSGVALVMACKTEKEGACTVDIDCGTGSFCRGGFCASPVDNSDGGFDGDIPQNQCLSQGSTCSVDGDCCQPPCNSFRCGSGGGTSGKTSSGTGTSGTSGASGTSGTSTSGMGNCVDTFGLCNSDTDCCTGLSCDPSSTSCR